MNIEAAIWAWLYAGIVVGLFSIVLVLWSIWFEYNNKE